MWKKTPELPVGLHPARVNTPVDSVQVWTQSDCSAKLSP